MRLFFALWPDDKVRKQINHIAKQSASINKGKLMKADNLHLTLAFLGNVNETQANCIKTKASAITFKPFDLLLDHTGTFSKAKVAWLGVSNIPLVLNDLATNLKNASRDCGIDLDDRFHPHVTLMRKVSRFHEEKPEPVSWSVCGFSLIESITHPEGVEYKVIQSWH